MKTKAIIGAVVLGAVVVAGAVAGQLAKAHNTTKKSAATISVR
jgi:outer membrane murein-binding lipoprotein Lpp